jgi:predicted Zn-dependent protease with MMP-like domain
MTQRDFDRLVEEAMAIIPARFRRLLDNVVFVVEAEPRSAGLLGLYEGRPLTERGVSESFHMPDKITIYQGPHERMARSVEELRRIVAETIWHEVAHHFGLDERQVRRAERRRERRSERRRRLY